MCFVLVVLCCCAVYVRSFIFVSFCFGSWFVLAEQTNIRVFTRPLCIYL